MSKQLRILIEEHKSRKEDFTVAAKNFQNFLNKSKLSSSQLEKLRRQYDTILEDYQESRQILDVRLPKVVNAYVNKNNIIVSINFEVNTAYVISFEKLDVFFKLERCCCCVVADDW